MPAEPATSSRRPPRDPLWWHLGLLALLAAAHESLYLDRGINVLDEGWPLYAAMRLHDGGSLYDDVLWVFPPLHVLPAWIGYALDPPGIVLTRAIYAAFNVALCLSLYGLGRRLMPAHFALLGAAMLAVAAPRSHLMHLLFGYRYLVLGVLALLCFDRRLSGGGRGWLAAAGAMAGLAFCFRVTPGVAAAAGIGVGLLAARRSPTDWLRDGLAFALGVAGALLPVALWFAGGVGLPRVWHEIAIHPFGMLQALPPPDWTWLPAIWDRAWVSGWFVAIQFRLWWVLYAAYAVALLASLLRARVRREVWPHALLLAVVVWGALYFTRTLGRSDEPHLDSAIPPVCLMLAHLAWLATSRWNAWVHAGRPARPGHGVCVAVFAAWVLLVGTDRDLVTKRRGTFPIVGIPETIYLNDAQKAQTLARTVHELRRWARPGETILDLSPSPYLYVLSERRGPGFYDVIMPGTFLREEEEAEFVERLAANPPAVVIWPRRRFDRMDERAVRNTAPRVIDFVTSRYGAALRGSRYVLFRPLETFDLSGEASGSPEAADGSSPEADGS